MNGSGGRLILAGGLNILISTSAKSVICPLKYPPRKEANHGNYNEWKNVSQMFSLYYENNWILSSQHWLRLGSRYFSEKKIYKFEGYFGRLLTLVEIIVQVALNVNAVLKSSLRLAKLVPVAFRCHSNQAFHWLHSSVRLGQNGKFQTSEIGLKANVKVVLDILYQRFQLHLETFICWHVIYSISTC